MESTLLQRAHSNWYVLFLAHYTLRGWAGKGDCSSTALSIGHKPIHSEVGRAHYLVQTALRYPRVVIQTVEFLLFLITVHFKILKFLNE